MFAARTTHSYTGTVQGAEPFVNWMAAWHCAHCTRGRNVDGRCVLARCSQGPVSGEEGKHLDGMGLGVAWQPGFCGLLSFS